MHALTPNPKTVHTLTDFEADILKGIYPDLPRTPAECPTCSGSPDYRKGVFGTFRWLDENDDIVDYQCNCIEQWMLHRFLLSCGIRIRYQRYGLMDAVGVEQAVLDQVFDYMLDLDHHLKTGAGLFLHGAGAGTGKTLLAALSAKQIVLRGHRPYFTSAIDLVNAYTKGWRDPEAAAWFDKKIRNSPFLVVDDLGKENRARSGVTDEVLDSVLRDRGASERPTIITSNLTEPEVRSAYGGYIPSLISESMQTIYVTGEDFRPQVATRVARERTERLTRPLVLA